MSGFSVAMDAIFSDPFMATDAVYLRGGVPPEIPCRIIRSRPDEVVPFGAARLAAATQMIDVRVSEIAMVSVGDVFRIDSVDHVVQSAPLADSERLVWSIDARPA